MQLKNLVAGIARRIIKKDRYRIPFGEIESNIKPLVEAINMRYQTRMSCEGHINRGCPYPWVDLATNQNLLILNESLNKYNSINKTTWILHESHFDLDENATVLRLMPECKVYGELSEYRKMTMYPKKLKELEAMSHEDVSLEVFQISAKDLAQYLKENWK